MNMKKSYVGFAGILLMLGAVLLLSHRPIFAESCQIVRITMEKGATESRLAVIPEKITVPPDTCVVWMNWVQGDRVSVSFRENVKQCVASTASPTGFNLNEGESCYMTEFLTRGKTASMYFNKPGVFKYTLELEGKPTVQREGVIEVK